jgi:hypothetical protein
MAADLPKGPIQAEDSSFDVKKYGWAVDIIVHHFCDGLVRVFDSKKIKKSLARDARQSDPIYSKLLESSGQDVYETFMAFWRLAQTFSTQSRFWLEEAICEIVRTQRKKFGVQVYSLRDLTRDGWHSESDLAFMGERSREWDSRRGAFRVRLARELLDYVELEVSQREREERLQKLGEEIARAEEFDHRVLEGIFARVPKGPWQAVPLQCNLLVVEPGEGHVWAFRYVNDKALSPSQMRREKVNVLRVHGWLCQEKVLRRPDKMTAVIAELLPRWNLVRPENDPEMFSPMTWWSHSRLWKFIGVPFEALEVAVARVGRDMRKLIVDCLSTLLPSTR